MAIGCAVRWILLVARRAILALNQKRRAHRERPESGSLVSALSALCVNQRGDDARHRARSGRVCARPGSSQGIIGISTQRAYR